MNLTRFTFVPLQQNDFSLLESWLIQPHVSRWFGNSAEWLTEIAANIKAQWILYFRVDVSGNPSGFAQYYHTELAPAGPWSSEPIGTLGIDFLLGHPEDLRKGLGS